MDIRQDVVSPNFGARAIEVEFLVLHYTAGDLQSTFDIFLDEARQVSSHLVISEEGEVFEMVRCWDGTAYRAHHAGKSWWFDGQRRWEGLNDYAIGIELVNLNGNLIAYPPAQYQALFEVVAHLQKLYPALQSAERVVGHEHIAGWRGKADPGALFDWQFFFESCYPGQAVPKREAIISADLLEALQRFMSAVPETPEKQTRFWHALSYMTEFRSQESEVRSQNELGTQMNTDKHR